MFLNTEKSKSARPGPLNTPRPKSPQVPAVGIAKALGLNHEVLTVKSWLPGTTGPVKDGFSEGRSGFLVLPSPERLEPSSGVNGKPVNIVAIPFTCQPPMSFSRTPPALGNG